MVWTHFCDITLHRLDRLKAILIFGGGMIHIWHPFDASEVLAMASSVLHGYGADLG